MTHVFELTVGEGAFVATDDVMRIERNGNQRTARVVCDELLTCEEFLHSKIFTYKRNEKTYHAFVYGEIISQSIT